jgi:hypothetical protein
VCVGKRAAQSLVFFVEDATGVRERLGVSAGFVCLLPVALRALLGGSEVLGEALDPRLCVVRCSVGGGSLVALGQSWTTGER